ncbi:lytic transglycosylase domain-containing protein [Streptomyces sp. Rer75]|uniref:lytic transglycosylase domain-containing protein n=1 Tax=unclassified Streptomyces TaxID=2593676 RepID=UPI0015D0C93A|nr:lytic transglycosylase domain-containing protein [Streptomyces sp. Rer75]QLH21463.1 lytic transglycosylase domain-containing protein [Streptomyces sp. Rer75]
MLSRAAGMFAAFVAGLALVVAAVLVVRQIMAPSEPELPVVPDARRPIVERAAKVCSPLSVPLLAAQIHAESNWRPDADSGHAQGISQFAPDTWKEWGRDGSGDGRADVWEPRDAIPSQAHYMCHLYGVIDELPGNRTRLALAAYNAGPGAVLRARGIPTIHETRGYVDRIVNTLLPQYRKSETRYQRSEAKRNRARSASPSTSTSASSSPSPPAPLSARTTRQRL